MTFSITKLFTDSNDKIIAMDWTYTNADGSCSQRHEMLKPYGDVLLADVTQAAAVGMLEQQIKTTSEYLDESIAQKNARDAYLADVEELVPNLRKDGFAPKPKLDLEKIEEQIENRPSTLPAPIDEEVEQPSK